MDSTPEEIAQARAALKAKFGGNAGDRSKGSARRVKKPQGNRGGLMVKQLEHNLKRHCTDVRALVSTVNVVTKSGKILVFEKPSLRLARGACCYTWQGPAKTLNAEDIAAQLPSAAKAMAAKLGKNDDKKPDNAMNFQSFMEADDGA